MHALFIWQMLTERASEDVAEDVPENSEAVSYFAGPDCFYGKALEC